MVEALRILIDGRSGSGKTELARSLAPLLGAQLVRLDDLYPGWDGLAAGSAAVPDILENSRWRSWDWVAEAPAGMHTVMADRPVIIEGVGALSRASRPFADVAFWVRLGDAERRVRALARDGALYEPHWDRWAAQERAFIRAEQPERLADLIIDGTSSQAALESALAYLAVRGITPGASRSE